GQAYPSFKLGQQRQLIWNNLQLRHWQREISDAIDFRKTLSSPRFWRPLHHKRVTGELRKIEVSFQGKGVHDFPAFLSDRRELNHVAFSDKICFFGEFAPCRGDKFITGFDQALRDGPGSGVLLCPKRATRMAEQDFKLRSAAKRQYSGADLRFPRHRAWLPLTASLYRRTSALELVK